MHALIRYHWGGLTLLIYNSHEHALIYAHLGINHAHARHWHGLLKSESDLWIWARSYSGRRKWTTWFQRHPPVCGPGLAILAVPSKKVAVSGMWRSDVEGSGRDMSIAAPHASLFDFKCTIIKQMNITLHWRTLETGSCDNEPMLMFTGGDTSSENFTIWPAFCNQRSFHLLVSGDNAGKWN